MKLRLPLLVVLFLVLPTADTQQKPSIPIADRIRLAETFRLAETLADEVWGEWSKAPFAVLLVTPEYEFLIHHPSPSEDFASAGYDSVLKSGVYFRKRIY